MSVSPTPLLSDGNFSLGVNYWASHAGTAMWSDWDESVIDSDFKLLADSGIRLVRIFPLWSDFQPIRMLYTANGAPYEVRYENEEPLPHTAEGQAGVCPRMIERFQTVCALAEKYGLSLIVGLLTGWMSGRLFVPRALEGHNLITDPFALRWELRYVQYLVTRFRTEHAIVAWELGNECNCLAPADRDSFFVWAKSLSAAIRECDATRPLAAGLHGLSPEGTWTPEDMGEVADLLTTHPYPLFTAHCHSDYLSSMKNALHATAESLMYSGMGGKPCFVEEIGTLGPMIADRETAAAYATAAALTAWAHGLRAFVWWCAFDQDQLTHAPYDWIALERELGVFTSDRQAKPIVSAFTRLQRYTDAFPEPLPAPLTDAVCIATKGQDAWGACFGTFLLAKQAGLNVRFCFAEDELPDSPVYLLPSLCGDSAIPYRVYRQLAEKVEHGATLYLSLGEATVPSFAALTGIVPTVRRREPRRDTVMLPSGNEVTLESPVTSLWSLSTGTALLSATTGEPALVLNRYGAGRVFTLNYPLELQTAAATDSELTARHEIYSLMNLRHPHRIAALNSPLCGLTEHPTSDGRRILVAVNYGSTPVTAALSVTSGWQITAFLPYGEADSLKNSTLTLAGHSAAALILETGC